MCMCTCVAHCNVNQIHSLTCLQEVLYSSSASSTVSSISSSIIGTLSSISSLSSSTWSSFHHFHSHLFLYNSQQRRPYSSKPYTFNHKVETLLHKYLLPSKWSNSTGGITLILQGTCLSDSSVNQVFPRFFLSQLIPSSSALQHS